MLLIMIVVVGNGRGEVDPSDGGVVNWEGEGQKLAIPILFILILF